MKPLKAFRENWEEIQALDDQMTRALTFEETIKQGVNLFALAPYFQEAAKFFLPEREKFLIEFQNRLQKLAEWQRKQSGKSL